MPGFIVDTAVTRTSRERVRGVEVDIPSLAVDGPAAGGGRNRARFVFSADIDGSHAAPVGYMTDGGAAGLSLIGWLPIRAFEVYRVIIESGVPLRVHYETRDGGAGYLRRLALGRLDAPPIVTAAFRRTTQRGSDLPAYAMPL